MVLLSIFLQVCVCVCVHVCRVELDTQSPTSEQTVVLSSAMRCVGLCVCMCYVCVCD